MRRKIELIAKILQSTIRLPFLSLWNLGKVQWKFPAAVSLSSNIKAIGTSRVRLGRRFELEGNSLIQARSGEIFIGDGVYINRNATIVCHEGIKIGSGTSIGPNSVVYDHDHDFRNDRGAFRSAAISIGSNVWIGSNVTILKGVSIGDDAVIGAGCVITKDVPGHVVVVNATQQRIMEIKKEGKA